MRLTFADTKTTKGTLLFHMKMVELYKQSDQIYKEHYEHKISLDDLAKKHNVSPKAIRTMLKKAQYNRLKDGLNKLYGKG